MSKVEKEFRRRIGKMFKHVTALGRIVDAQGEGTGQRVRDLETVARALERLEEAGVPAVKG